MTARSETFYRYAGEIAQDLDTAVVTTLDAAPPACTRDESAELEAFASADEMAAVIRVLRSGLKSIHVAGISGDVGRDSILLSLARILAETGRRILVVDADADGPPLAEPGSVGLTDVLAGSVSLAEAVVPSPGYEGMMAFLPVGTQLAALEAPGATEPFARALAELRPSYDVALVSAPCLDRRGKVHPAATSCEGVLLVLSPSVVSRDRIRRNFLQLWGVEAPIRGLITLGVPDVLAEVLPQEKARTELEMLPKPTNLTLARGGTAAVAAGGRSGGEATTPPPTPSKTQGSTPIREADPIAANVADDDPGVHLDWAEGAPAAAARTEFAAPRAAKESDPRPVRRRPHDAGSADDLDFEASEISFDATDDDADDGTPSSGGRSYPYSTSDGEPALGEDDTYDSEPAEEPVTAENDNMTYDDGGTGGGGGRGRLITIGALAAVTLAAAAWLWPQLSGRDADSRSGALAAYQSDGAIPEEVVVTEAPGDATGSDSRAVPPARSSRLPDGARGDSQPVVPADEGSRWERASGELAKAPSPTGKSWIDPKNDKPASEKAAASDVRASSVSSGERATSPPPARRVTPPPSTRATSPTSTASSTSMEAPSSAALIDAKSGTIQSDQFAGRSPFYAVHITSFRKRGSAVADANRLTERTGQPAEVIECYLQGAGSKSGTWYRVLVGEYEDSDAATVAKNTFIDDGITDWCRVYKVTS